MEMVQIIDVNTFVRGDLKMRNIALVIQSHFAIFNISPSDAFDPLGRYPTNLVFNKHPHMHSLQVYSHPLPSRVSNSSSPQLKQPTSAYKPE